MELRGGAVGTELEQHIFYGMETEKSVAEVIVERVVRTFADSVEQTVHGVLVERP